MQKITISLLMVLQCFVLCLGQEDKEEFDFTSIKFNLLSPLVNSFNFSVERAVDKISTIEVGMGLHSRKHFFSPSPGFKGKDLSVSVSNSSWQMTRRSLFAQWNIYVKKDAPNGFFVGPYVRMTSCSLGYDVNNEQGFTIFQSDSWMAYGFGVDNGYSYCFNKKWHVSAFIGLGYDTGSSMFPKGMEYKSLNTWRVLVPSYLTNGFDARFGLNFGLAF